MDGGGPVRVVLRREQPDLLRGLLGEMHTLLEADIPRADPVVSRLSPEPGYDAEDARTYRSPVEAGLRIAKRRSLEAVTNTLGAKGPVAATPDADESLAWLAVLTDLRLAIGPRLGVDEAMM